ncbi:hypothetical protein CALVIDRAFT_476931 [Calocera viscosa TUFC12733]|uniref:Copper transport protein n=1 Tax=Calocera viscosa (strain TUFC12733) TaxID=1330018 RepID=A0A167QG31_CALVF|nr:hypothetical protein CALVIDRAFT_476931 [Calocera viscosa TUFC12733]
MDGSTTMANGTMGMLLGFHATPFDQLWFAGWAPQTNGAMVGACVGLFLLAIIDRWVAAIRGLCEVWWKQRCKKSTSSDMDVEDCCTPSSTPALAYRTIPPPFPTRLSAMERLIPPFIASQDLPRGALQVAQAALGYALMLAFMQFNWGYCLAILAGLGVGEVLFGRYANHGGAHSMTGSS